MTSLRPTRTADWRGKTAQALVVGHNLSLHSPIYDSKLPSAKRVKAKKVRK